MNNKLEIDLKYIQLIQDIQNQLFDTNKIISVKSLISFYCPIQIQILYEIYLLIINTDKTIIIQNNNYENVITNNGFFIYKDNKLQEIRYFDEYHNNITLETLDENAIYNAYTKQKTIDYQNEHFDNIHTIKIFETSLIKINQIIRKYKDTSIIIDIGKMNNHKLFMINYMLLKLPGDNNKVKIVYSEAGCKDTSYIIVYDIYLFHLKSKDRILKPKYANDTLVDIYKLDDEEIRLKRLHLIDYLNDLHNVNLTSTLQCKLHKV